MLGRKKNLGSALDDEGLTQGANTVMTEALPGTAEVLPEYQLKRKRQKQPGALPGMPPITTVLSE